MSDQAKDRTDPTKAAALRGLGDSYRALGEQIRAIARVPSDIQNTHNALATSYIDLGTKLAQVSAATDDKSFVAAITTYNSSVETFTRAYIDVATYLSVSNVRFSETDRGSVFSFQGNQ